MNFLVLGLPYYDLLQASVVEGLKACGHTVYGYNGDARNYMEPYAGQPIDIFIYAPLAHMNDIELSLKVPKILLWVHDRFDFGNVDCSKYTFDLAFIRDYTQQCGNKVFPINFAIESRYYEHTNSNQLLLLKERPIDIIFQGNVETLNRPRFLNQLLEDFDDYNLNIGFSAKQEPHPYWSQWVNGRTQHWSDYYRLLSHSKICISLFGMGDDTARTWEAFASGGLPAIQKYQSILVEPAMQDGVNCITFEQPEDMIVKIRYLLKHPDEAQRIADNAFRFGKEHHTTRKRGEYILRIMKEEGII